MVEGGLKVACCYLEGGLKDGLNMAVGCLGSDSIVV